MAVEEITIKFILPEWKNAGFLWLWNDKGICKKSEDLLWLMAHSFNQAMVGKTSG